MDWFGTQRPPAPAPAPPPAPAPVSDPFADLRFAPRTSRAPASDGYPDRVEYGDSARYSPSGVRPAPADHPSIGYPPPVPYRPGPPAEPPAGPAGPRQPRHGAPEYFTPDGTPEPAGAATGHLPPYREPAIPPAPADTPAPAAETEPRTPAGSRLLSLGTTAVSVVLFGAVGLTVGRGQLALLGACVVIQVVFVLAWTIGGRRPGPWVVAVVGLGCAAAADAYGAFGAAVAIGPFGYVMAGGMIAAAFGQLLRGRQREAATDSLGATLVAMLGAVAVPALLVLARHGHGTAGVMVTVAAGGAGVVVARFADVIVPKPRASLRVPRGFIGLPLGGIVAGVAAGYLVGERYGLAPDRAAVAGLVVGLAAVLTDVGVSWGTAGRDLAGETPAGWPATVLLGPAAAVAVAALAGYVLGVLVLLPSG